MEDQPEEPSLLVKGLHQQQQQQRRMTMQMMAMTTASTAQDDVPYSSSSMSSSSSAAAGVRVAGIGGWLGGPPIEAIRQTLQRIQQQQQHKNHHPRRPTGNGLRMEEDSSLEGGYNGSASENETALPSMGRGGSRGGGGGGASSSSPASEYYDTTSSSEDSGSDDHQQQQQHHQRRHQQHHRSLPPLSQQPGHFDPTTSTSCPRANHIINNNTRSNNNNNHRAVLEGGGAAEAGGGRCGRPLLRVKRVRSDFTDDIADYSDSMILSSCSTMTKEADMAASSSSEEDGGGCAAASRHDRKPAPVDNDNSSSNKLFSVDCAIMAHILTYLDPPTILDTLTIPLNKKWVTNYTRNPELWRVLCLLEPFKAEVDDDDDDEPDSENDDDDDDDDDSFKGIDFGGKDCLTNENYTKYRLTYTSFVKCARYLTRITDDSRNGRPLTVMGFGNNNDRAGRQLIAANRNLQRFFSKAREVTTTKSSSSSFRYNGRMISEDDDAVSNSAVLALSPSLPKHRSSSNKRPHHHHHHHHHGDNTRVTETTTAAITTSKKAKHSVVAAAAPVGPSKLTSNLLGPASAEAGGTVAGGDVELPWSCAIFSIVNWMVGFSDVEGILTMCLKALPLLLEDEQQRIAAQGSGLTDIILRSMVSFPTSATLHTAAFHTIVLLARPIGGREGMLFHSSMVNTNGIFNSNEVGSASGKSGIAVLLDSMRRFVDDETLQAMGCWSLVNIALAPSQQDILIKLGAVDVALTAMVQHKDSAEVQFRALFALINLIIPPSSVGPRDDPPTAPAVAAPGPAVAAAIPPPQEPDNETLAGSDSDGSVDVDQIVELVVGCMKHYSSNESILNRACLVLHNLSLNTAFHSTMLWTPHCYLMLEWCLKNYPNDRVMQQGALNTIQRLQTTLSRSAALRKKFRASLKSQRPQFRQQVEAPQRTLRQPSCSLSTTAPQQQQQPIGPR